MVFIVLLKKPRMVLDGENLSIRRLKTTLSSVLA